MMSQTWSKWQRSRTSSRDFETSVFDKFITFIYPLSGRVVGAPQMILQPVFSIFPCSPLPSETCRTSGLSILSSFDKLDHRLAEKLLWLFLSFFVFVCSFRRTHDVSSLGVFCLMLLFCFVLMQNCSYNLGYRVFLWPLYLSLPKRWISVKDVVQWLSGSGIFSCHLYHTKKRHRVDDVGHWLSRSGFKLIAGFVTVEAARRPVPECHLKRLAAWVRTHFHIICSTREKTRLCL